MHDKQIDALLAILTTISHQLSDVILLLNYPMLASTPQEQYNSILEKKE